MEKKVELYNGNMTLGVEVSQYGIEKGYLDYKALANIVGGCILNNNLRSAKPEDWELVSGEFDCERMIFQDYIITEEGARFLFDFTDEYVFYNEDLDLHIWGVTHYGTSWDYVLTDIRVGKRG